MYNYTEEQEDIFSSMLNALEGDKDTLLSVHAVAGSSKQQPMTAIVKTANGDKTFRDLRLGDMVYSRNGELTKVTGIYPQGVKDVYTITFRDGTSTKCGIDHNWAITTISMRDKNKTRVMTTKEILDYGIQSNSGAYKCKIPLCKPINYTEKDLPLDPYILGAFLGDGSYRNSTPLISSHVDDQFILRKIKDRFKTYHNIDMKLNCRHTSENGVQTTMITTTAAAGKRNPIAALLDSIDQKRNKHIPELYLRGSIQQRLDLLQGLMDTDGACRLNRSTFSNTNPSIIAGVVSLVQSLGGTVIYHKDHRAQDARATVKNLNIKMFTNPFSLPRKANNWKVSTKNPPSRYITSITKDEEQVEQVCITVDAEDSLYLTNDFIVTHNTTSLVEGMKRIYAKYPQVKARYIVFGTANADEAKTEFGHTTQVSTIHSLAYQEVKKHYNLSMNLRPFITWKDIPKNIKIPFGRTYELLNLLDTFLNSTYSIEEFINSDKLPNILRKPFKQIIDAMLSNDMPITHNFYLKLFHTALTNGDIKLPKVDLLLLDEVNDVTLQTLDVFKAYPAKVKIMVGDNFQSIHKWMGCINAFPLMEPDKVLTLSKSFRCNTTIAEYVEEFGKKFLDPNFIFKGHEYTDPKIKTTAFIARGNNTLVAKMITLNAAEIPYRLSTKDKPNQMFALPLAVINAPGFKQNNIAFKGIQNEIDNWGKQSEEFKKANSKTKYLLEVFKGDDNITKALKLVLAEGPIAIREAFNKAKEHTKSGSTYIITTAHSSKGLSLDEVTLADDMNTSIEDIVLSHREGNYAYTDEEQEAINLYYVACTRARHRVNNARWLGNSIIT